MQGRVLNLRSEELEAGGRIGCPLTEDLSGHLGIPHTLSPRNPVSPTASPHFVCDHICIYAGCDHDEALQLEELHTLERAHWKKICAIPVGTEVSGGVDELTCVDDGVNKDVTDEGVDNGVSVDVNVGTNGGADDDADADVDVNINTKGGVDTLFAYHVANIFYSVDVLADFLAFLSSVFP